MVDLTDNPGLGVCSFSGTEMQTFLEPQPHQEQFCFASNDTVVLCELSSELGFQSLNWQDQCQRGEPLSQDWDGIRLSHASDYYGGEETCCGIGP